MALELVTLEEAAAQLRTDDDAVEDWLAVWIPAVSEAVRAWLKDDSRLYLPSRDSDGALILDSDGYPIPSDEVHPSVKGAVLVELASQRRFAEGEGENRMPSQDGYGFPLCRGATNLLMGLRKPTVA